MKQTLRKYSGLLYIAIMTIVLVVIILCNNELPEIVRALSTLRLRYVCLSVGMVLMYLFVRSLTLRYYICRRASRLSLLDTFVITGVGQFYSAITPSASGGQPMQIYYMHKLGVPISTASGAISAKFIGFELMVMLVGGVGWLFNAQFIAQQLWGGRYLVAIGFCVNSLFLLATVCTFFRILLIDRAIGALVRFAGRLHIVKDVDASLEKVLGILGEYRQSMRELMNNPVDTVVMFLLSLVQVLCYMSILPCLYWAFGNTGCSYFELLTLQTLLFITASFVPLPGAAGAQEGGFYWFFRGAFSQKQILATMVIWRFLTYYVLLLFGIVMLIIYGVKTWLRERKAGENGR